MATKKRHRVDYYDDPVLLGRRLRQAREAAGLSQRALSFPGCTAAYISRIEKGDRVPSLQLIREFAARLGVGEQFLSHGYLEPATAGATLVEARVAVRMGELDAARELAHAVLTEARSDRERAQASALFGEIELEVGSARPAIDALERARHLDATLEQNDPGVGEALGRAYARALDHESAIAVFERNRAAAEEAGDTLNVIRFSSLLANAYADSGDFGRAEETLAHAIRLGEHVRDPFEQAELLWAQSRLQAQQHNPAGAARYAERALEILEVFDYSLHIGLAHLLRARIELDRGAAPGALEALARAEPIVAASGRTFELTSLRIERARALAQLERAEEAAAAATEARDLMAELSGIDAGRGYALIAEVWERLGEDERAQELYELALVNLEGLPNRYAVDAFSKLAALLERRGEKDAALEVLKRAMNVQRRTERPVA